MTTTHHRIRRSAAFLAAGVLALGLTACGDDDDTAATDDTSTTVADAPEGEGAAEDHEGEDHEGDHAEDEGDEGAADGETVVITAVDWGFEGLPEEVPVGTKLSLSNEGDEPHELVAMRIPDSETRPVSELVKLPQEELMGIFGAGAAPATVILAAHGTTDTPGAVVGDGTLTEPGRYAIVCFLPVGSDDSILDSAGPPESDAPPHVSQGMFAELVVS